MNTYCTIVTKSHLPWAYSLHDSLLNFDKQAHLNILVTNILDDYTTNRIGTTLIKLKDIVHFPYAVYIIEKYKDNLDSMRWSLKPILMSYLLDKFNKVMFLDCDIYFCSDHMFLWDDLNDNDVLITPHWFNYNEPNNVQILHTTGINNGGFIASNTSGKKALEWWAKMCLHKCDSKYGTINVDQGYLEMLPFFFDNVKILKHKGLNVSYWSKGLLKKYKRGDTYYVHDGMQEFPLVFYHFAASKYQQFLNDEKDIFSLLESLNISLKNNGYKKDLIQMAHEQSIGKTNETFYKKLITFLKMNIPYRVYKIN